MDVATQAALEISQKSCTDGVIRFSDVLRILNNLGVLVPHEAISELANMNRDEKPRERLDDNTQAALTDRQKILERKVEEEKRRDENLRQLRKASRLAYGRS